MGTEPTLVVRDTHKEWPFSGIGAQLREGPLLAEFTSTRMSAPAASRRRRDRPPSPAVAGVSNDRQAAIFNPTEMPALAHRPTR